ncbi:MAG: hypothetical protein C0501_16020 [Isosphaera sp.]|nr:hypothetical protein [Isosphaera sp.]
MESIIDLSTVNAEWSRATDVRGRPGAFLHLRDRSGAEAGVGFLPEEVRDDEAFETRLRGLKDALLKVAAWRLAVERLLTTIQPWSEALPGNPLVRREPVRVVEARSGGYETSKLVITRGGREMRVMPVAAWALGADGRVDMIGPDDTAVLEYARATDSWRHVPNDLPYRELPLTEVLFRELAETCLGEHD